MNKFTISNLHKILLGLSNEGQWGIEEKRNVYIILVRKCQGKRKETQAQMFGI
jgi:hypothetical protein